jgi:hypothetical protein
VGPAHQTALQIAAEDAVGRGKSGQCLLVESASWESIANAPIA